MQVHARLPNPYIAQVLNPCLTCAASEEAIHEAELRRREAILGPNRPEVAESLSNLAILYNQRGAFDRAQPLYERALRIYESEYGPNSTEVAHTLTDLAVLHLEQVQAQPCSLLYLKSRLHFCTVLHVPMSRHLVNRLLAASMEGRQHCALSPDALCRETTVKGGRFCRRRCISRRPRLGQTTLMCKPSEMCSRARTDLCVEHGATFPGSLFLLFPYLKRAKGPT